jgi:hypothetical protein
MLRLAFAACLAAGPLSAQVVFVDASATGSANGSSWSDAFPDLQAALAAAQPGEEIWVAAGTYRPAPAGGNRASAFRLPPGVALYGGFEGTELTLEDRKQLFDLTILSGDLDGNDVPGFGSVADNSYHVVVIPSTSAGAVLDGFTIVGGNAAGVAPGEDSGGGLCIKADAHVRNAFLRSNRALAYGGAVYVVGALATLFEECDLEENRAELDGGGVHQAQGSPLLLGVLLRANHAVGDGGGAYLGGAVVVEDCTIEENSAGGSGGGAEIAPGTLAVSTSAFRKNQAGQSSSTGFGGGLCAAEVDGFLEGSMFVANQALRGGGVDRSGAPAGVLRVDACTFYGNQALANGAGGGLYCDAASVALRGSLLWANIGTGGADFPGQMAGGSITAEYSCIQALTPAIAATLGQGNLGDDPMLADPDGQDGLLGTADDRLELLVGSPCIDAGTVDAVSALDLDFYARPRRTDDPETVDSGSGTAPAPDIGASEHHSLTASKLELSIAVGGTTRIDFQAGPDFAGDLYIVLGSASGTVPGLTFAGHTLLLNPDPYFFKTLNEPDSLPLFHSLDFLDSAGGTLAIFFLPAGLDPVLVGLELHHAAAVLDTATLFPVYTSTSYPLTLVP